MPEQGSAGKELSVKQEPGAEKTLGGLAKTTFAPKVKPRRRNAKANAKKKGVDLLQKRPSKTPNKRSSLKKREKRADATSNQRAKVAFMAPAKDPQKEAAAKKARGSSGIKGSKSDSSDYIIDPRKEAANKPEVIGMEAEEVFADNGRIERARRAAELKAENSPYHPLSTELENDDPLQYRPNALPYPDLKGFEVRAKQQDEAAADVPAGVHLEPAITDSRPSMAPHWFRDAHEKKEGEESSNIFFIQLPSHLPYRPTLPKSENGEIETASMNRQESCGGFPLPSHEQGMAKTTKLFSMSSDHALKSFPSGQFGKLLIHKSGKIKLQLGDATTFDVSEGVTVLFDQKLVSVDVKSEMACDLGQVQNRLVCTLDMDDILRNTSEGVEAAEAVRKKPQSAAPAAAEVVVKEEAGLLQKAK